MIRPTFLNIILYFFVKYMALFGLLMIKNRDYKLLEQQNLLGGHSLTYFVFIMLPLPILSLLLFGLPTYYSFKVKNILGFIILINCVLLAEYFLYTYLASQENLWNGIYLAIISILVIALFFYRHIISMLKRIV